MNGATNLPITYRLLLNTADEWWKMVWKIHNYKVETLTFGAGIIFLILAHSVYKMRIIQEPDTLEL